MRIYDCGIYRDLTEEEISEREAEAQKAEAEYWANVDYNTAVEAEIAKRHTIQQELGIQRQKDEKPEEYETYYAYCEQCKAFVKEMKAKHGEEVISNVNFNT